MSKGFVEKNIKLSLELDRYLSKNPSAFGKIPKGACLFITIKGDEKFNDSAFDMVGEAKEKNQKCIEARKEGARWSFSRIIA